MTNEETITRLQEERKNAAAKEGAHLAEINKETEALKEQRFYIGQQFQSRCGAEYILALTGCPAQARLINVKSGHDRSTMRFNIPLHLDAAGKSYVTTLPTDFGLSRSAGGEAIYG